MKKIVIGLLLGLLFGYIISSFAKENYWEYSYGNHPASEDGLKAEINKAIAIQKIAEEGITLNIVFKNKLEVDKKE